jgi:hypothetical protein
METEKSLVKSSEVKLPEFVENAYRTIEGMKQFATILLESRIVPDHFYEKGVDNKPDYAKGKTSAVMVVLIQAQQLSIPPMTALQHVIPINGLLSIKGDLAKTMIFSSGKLRKDSWKETVTGSIEGEDMVVTISATREDNGLSLTRTFSVEKAKRMGLWITSQQVNGQDGWKFKKSAWYRTPDRMIQYRALGFLARDLFSDVLNNMYTTEEAVDINLETAEIISTDSGATITIPDKEHAQKRSGKMTERVADKIPENKFKPVQDATIIEPVNMTVIQPEVKNESMPQEKKVDDSPFKADKGSIEYMKGVKVIRDETGKIVNEDEIYAAKAKESGSDPDKKKEGTCSEGDLMDMKVEELLKIVNADMDMMEAMQLIPGKNTNKKLRGLILAHQDGRLTEYTAPFLSDNKEENEGTLKPDAEGEKASGNKFGLIPPPFDKGQTREFSTCKTFFNVLSGLNPPINTNRYIELAIKTGIIGTYPDKETFCKLATNLEINALLNEN